MADATLSPFLLLTRRAHPHIRMGPFFVLSASRSDASPKHVLNHADVRFAHKEARESHKPAPDCGDIQTSVTAMPIGSVAFERATEELQRRDPDAGEGDLGLSLARARARRTGKTRRDETA